MSAEIAGFEPRDELIVAEAVLTAAAISVETGVPAEVAYSNRGAEYAVKLTLVALRQMGIFTTDIDVRAFTDRIVEIEHKTIPAKAWKDS